MYIPYGKACVAFAFDSYDSWTTPEIDRFTKIFVFLSGNIRFSAKIIKILFKIMFYLQTIYNISKFFILFDTLKL